MAWKLSAIPLVVMFCVVGCSRSDRAGTGYLGRGKDPLIMTMERLESENLPALESVEIWENGYGPGLKLTTDHYHICTTLLEPLMLRTLPGYIESAYWGYNDQLPQPIETAGKFTVYLFGNRRQWESFTRAFAGDQAPVFCKIRTGAYYHNGACVIYDIGRQGTLSAIGHEGWHQFNSRHFRYRLPSWLDEGIAMLFEASTYENGMFSFIPEKNYQRLGGLSETLGGTKLIPLRDLITTSPGEVIAMDQTETVMAFYSQSYALVRFLREAGNGKHATRYHRMLWDGLLGEWPLDKSAGRIAEDRNLARTVDWNRLVGARLFEHYVGSDFEELQREYLAYCRRMVHGMSFVRADDRQWAGVHR